jgi:hypothetical protein
MNRFRSNIILYAGLLVVSGLTLFVTTCCCKYPDLVQDIIVGVFSAVLLLLFLEIRELMRDKDKYGQLSGKYKRIEIYEVDNSKTADTKYVSLHERYKGVDPNFEFIYHGDRQYSFEAQYEEGKLKSTIYMDETNPKEGNGHYQYLNKDKKYILPDIGYYQLQVDTQNPKRILLFHKNLIPSGLAEGYEVLERN